MADDGGDGKGGGSRALERLGAWLVTGPVGRGLSFAVDFGAALLASLARRR